LLGSGDPAAAGASGGADAAADDLWTPRPELPERRRQNLLPARQRDRPLPAPVGFGGAERVPGVIPRFWSLLGAYPLGFGVSKGEKG